MLPRQGVMLVVILPLAFAAVSLATTVPPFSIAQGPITSLAPSEVTVQANAEVPTSCARTSSSPAAAGLKVGDLVTIDCKQGVLVSITAGRRSRQGVLIPGLAGMFVAALPVPGPRPTMEQCVAAWNTTAPLTTREAVGRLTPLAAQVSTATEHVLSVHPSIRTIAEGPICKILFVLRGVRTASVSSLWEDGSAPEWSSSSPGSSLSVSPGSGSQRTGRSAALTEFQRRAKIASTGRP